MSNVIMFPTNDNDLFLPEEFPAKEFEKLCSILERRFNYVDSADMAIMFAILVSRAYKDGFEDERSVGEFVNDVSNSFS